MTSKLEAAARAAAIEALGPCTCYDQEQVKRSGHYDMECDLRGSLVESVTAAMVDLARKFAADEMSKHECHGGGCVANVTIQVPPVQPWEIELKKAIQDSFELGVRTGVKQKEQDADERYHAGIRNWLKAEDK